MSSLTFINISRIT